MSGVCAREERQREKREGQREKRERDRERREREGKRVRERESEKGAEEPTETQ